LLKKGDDNNDEVDDEVKTTVPSQNRGTATLLNTEESFLSVFIVLSYQQRDVGGGGRTRKRQSPQYL
jgi:hypothetical protein